MEKLKIAGFLDYRFICELKYSPDFQHAAFVVSRGRLEENKYNSCLYVCNHNGENVRQLTFQGDGKTFVWLDEESLLFPALREEADKKKAENGEQFTTFYKIGISGGEACEYFTVPLAVNSLKCMDQNVFAMVCKYNPKDHCPEKMDYEIFDEIPFWANGEGITNKTRKRLYLYHKPQDKLVPITDEYTNVSCYNADKEGILFVANRYTDKKEITSGVYRYDICGDKTEVLVEDGRYSVDYVDFMGKDVVVTASDMKRYGLNENKNFYLIHENKMNLLCEPDEHVGSAVGSDCRYGAGTNIKTFKAAVYFTAASHTDTLLRRISGTGAVETLIKGQGSVDGFDVCDDGILFYGMRGQKLQEVYSVTNGAETQLTFFNQAVTDNKETSVPQPLAVRSGDTLIEGFVILPTDFDDKKRYPAILNIHGGPKSAFGSVFFHEMQVMANEGYFVFFCNPRGSEGQGNAFADIRGKYGTVDYDDLMRFTDAALEKYPQIDGSRLGVTGGSYGGYMTNWIIGHTDRFKCAVSQRSIANWISKFGTTDIGYYFDRDQQASTPWDKPEKIWWHSPLKYADKVRTPTLFLHSDEDYRCWLGEGLQMFSALKYHGVDAKMCLFHGENHELSRSGKPKNRIARLTEMIGWFDKYLKE